MKIFLSYPSVQRPLAERMALALEAEGHEVFFDRHDLDAGEAFHQRLREGIGTADAMVFLVTPESVARGSYTLTELDLARQRWRRPSGHVLPVMMAPTPIAELPAYLAAVTVLQPQGEPVAETVAAVARLGPDRSARTRRLAIGVLAILGVIAVAGYGVARSVQARAEEQARVAAQARDLSQATSARELCISGGHAVALTQLNEIAARPQAPAEVLALREDCAMAWMRDMRAVGGKTTFSEQVAIVQPVLLQGLARVQGPPPGPATYLADLRAHIGWGEYLRSRDGTPGVDPTVHWKRALVDDPQNVYAHAMWGRLLLARDGGLAEARSHFAPAVASGRNRPFVRGLQLGGALGGREDLHGYAVAVADEMRRGKERLLDIHRDRLWRDVFSTRLLDGDYRQTLLSALPPADLLQTFLWLFPPATVPEERRLTWRFALSTLQAHAGDRAAARAGFDALVRELKASQRGGRLLDEAQRGLDRLR
jgi:hypothetical protein